MAQWKRVGPIIPRSEDRNLLPANFFIIKLINYLNTLIKFLININTNKNKIEKYLNIIC